MGVVIRGITQQPDLYQGLEQKWNQTLPKPTDTGTPQSK
jgi:hypothetical protein